MRGIVDSKTIAGCEEMNLTGELALLAGVHQGFFSGINHQFRNLQRSEGHFGESPFGMKFCLGYD
jgi:hypothetical protein